MNRNQHMLTWHLMRKDCSQALALVFSLFAVAVAFQVLSLFQYRGNTDFTNQLVLIGMPCLFALGAGALLIGQEKENRTITWLRSMPIPPKAIIQSKIYTALACLVLSWILSLVVYVFVRWIQSAEIGWMTWPWHAVSLWPMNSLILMLAGIAMAWRFQSTLNSLLLILPISLIPSILGQLMGLFVGDEYFHIQLFVLLGLGALILIAYGVVTAKRQLSPIPAPRFARGLSTNTRIPAAIPGHWSSPQSCGDALLRQFCRQNQILLLVSLATLIVIPSLFVLYATDRIASRSTKLEEFGVAALIATTLTTSWLGVLSFHGDRLQQRIRFLADRGVSPSMVWLTRHAVPIGIVALSGIAFSISVALRVPNLEYGSVHWSLVPGLSVLYLFVLTSIYALSQWAAQILLSPVIAAILAPAWVVLIVGYFAFGVAQLGAPFWSIFVPMVLPFIATLTQMRRWMDLRTSGGFWVVHGFLLAVVLLVPALYIGKELTSDRGIPPSIRQALEANTGSLNTTAHRDVDAMQPHIHAEPSSAEEFPASIQDSILQVEAKLMANLQSGAECDTGQAVEHWKNLQYRALQLLSDLASTSKRNAYRDSVALMLQVAKNLRQGGLRQQTNADVSEILLVKELQRADAIELLGAEMFDSVARYCADSEFRDRARRRAVAVSWKVSSRRNSTFGGYDVPTKSRSELIDYYFAASRQRDATAWHLWNLLDARDPVLIEQAAEQVRSDWNGTFHFADESAYNVLHLTRGLSFPGEFWRGKWEKQAEELWAARNRANRELSTTKDEHESK